MNEKCGLVLWILLTTVTLLPGKGNLSKQDEAALRDIQNYEALVKTASGRDAKTLAAVVNPFPARSGGRFFGSIYEFHRNDNFDARNFFDPVGRRLPEYKRNQFGLTAGFKPGSDFSILGSFEGLRIIKGSTLLSHVPSSAMKQGDFSHLQSPILDPITGMAFPENQIPRERFSPVAERLLPVLPDPNLEDPDRNFINNQPLVRYADTLVLRADYRINQTSKVAGNFEHGSGSRRNVHRLPGFGSESHESRQSFSSSYTGNFSNRLLTSLELNFDRYSYRTLAQNAGRPGLLQSLGIEGVGTRDSNDEGYPQFSLSGYAGFGDGGSPQTSVVNRAEIGNFFTVALNGHTLQAGAELAGRQLNDFRSGGLRRGRFSFYGSFTGDAFADFLLGLPDAAYRAVGSDRVDLRRMQWQAFIRDQWKVRTNLELSLGLSYVSFEPYRSTGNNVSTFHPLLFEPPANGAIVIGGSPEARRLGFHEKGSLVFSDRNDWAPRVGLAFNPRGNNRLVVRSSYSIWYEPMSDTYFVDNLSRNFPFYFVESAVSPSEIPLLTLASPFERASSTELTIKGIEPHLKTAQIQNWELLIQNEIARAWLVEASYSGRRGTHMSRNLQANVPLPGTGVLQDRRPNPAYGQFEIATAAGGFTGHELEVSAEKRLADGFSFKSGLEWNRVLDDYRYGHDPNNPRNLSAERAPSAFPARRLFLNYIVDLPLGRRESSGPAGWSGWLANGWRLSGVTAIQDGIPFSVTMSGDPNQDGLFGDRPNRLSSGLPGTEGPSIDRWFDTGAFAAPAAYAFGDSGRNILEGPAYQSWDVSVIKRNRLSNGDHLEIRVELFNALNQVNFQRPDTEYGTSLFGKIFGAEHAREIEFALKYSF